MLWFDDFTDLDTSELLTVASAEIAPQAERCIPDSSAKQVRVVAQHSAWRIRRYQYVLCSRCCLVL
jgi:hypothetical protein